MEYALVMTATGLMVAIPSILAYIYIVSRVKGFVLEIQTSSAEIIDLLLERLEDSMKFKIRLKPSAALIDLTPLVDIIFLMLIFFIVTSDILPLKSLLKIPL